MRGGAGLLYPVAKADVRLYVPAVGDYFSNLDLGGSVSPRLVKVLTDEQVWGGKYDIWLDNDDSWFVNNSKWYQGRYLMLYFGFETITGSYMPRIWVDQQHLEADDNGKQLVHLDCLDAFGLMCRVKDAIGGSYWNHSWQSEEQLQQMKLEGGDPIPQDIIDKIVAHYDKTITEIVNGTISEALDASYIGTHDYVPELDEKPVISATDARSVIAQALAPTQCFLRWEFDNKFHIRWFANMDSFDFTDNDMFYESLQTERIMLPNRTRYHFIDKSDPDPANWVWDYREAEDNESVTRLGVYIDENHNLEASVWEAITDEQVAQRFANKRMLRLMMGKYTSSFRSLMHCGLEILDHSILTEHKYNPPEYGYSTNNNIYRLKRAFDKGEYSMIVTLGGAETGYTPPDGFPVSIAYHPLSLPFGGAGSGGLWKKVGTKTATLDTAKGVEYLELPSGANMYE